jgi:hypothetical protein
VGHATPETLFYFKELSEKINGKICPYARSGLEQPYPDAADRSMDLPPPQNRQ